MRKKKSGKRLMAFYALVATLAVFGSSTATTLANNYKDTEFSFDYSGDGSDIAEIARTKEDNSYTYVNVSSKSTGTLSVAAAAKTGITNGKMGNAFNFDYVTNRYAIKSGNRKYFPNAARKKGFSATYLVMASNDHLPHYYSGKWSPDNISGYN